MSGLISLSELFRDSKEERFFWIPDYQRSYSWEKENRDDLLYDIQELNKHRQKHFTGTIVAAKPSSNSEFEKEYEVVDGQQRLTSLVLLIARLLLKIENDFGPEEFAGFDIEEKRDQYIRRVVGPGNFRFRLTLNSETNFLFERLITNIELPEATSTPVNKAQANLKQAAQEYDEFLRNKNIDELTLLFGEVTNNLGFLFYTPNSGPELGIMFEVINNRGKPLSELDKVKNFLIYYSNRHEMYYLHKQINQAWSEILMSLNRVAMTNNQDEQLFLQSCWIPFREPRSRKSIPVYQHLKKLVEDMPLDHGYEHLSSFVELLRHGAYTFKRLYLQDDNDLSEQEALWLERLAYHPALATVLPLIIALYYRESDTNKRIDTLKLIEKLNFRYYVLGVAGRADSKQSQIFKLAYDYFHGSNDGDITSVEELQTHLRDFIGYHAGRSRVVRSLILEEDEGWNAYDWRGLKFFLASYEQYLCEKMKQKMNICDLLKHGDPDHYNDAFQREHILSLNSYDGLDEYEEDFNQCRLGNFILLRAGENSSVSNYPLVDKVGIRRNGEQIEEGLYAQNKLMDLYQVQELDEMRAEAEDFIWKTQEWKIEAKGARTERIKYFFDCREESLVYFALRRWHVPEVDGDYIPSIVIDSVTENTLGSKYWFE